VTIGWFTQQYDKKLYFISRSSTTAIRELNHWWEVVLTEKVDSKSPSMIIYYCR